MNRRNFAFVLTHGAGMWWYDYGPTGDSGWWDQPVLLGDIERIRKLDDEAIQLPEHSVADVLLVYDTGVFYHLAIQRSKKDPVSYAAVDSLSNAAYHTGAAIDAVLLADLKLVKLNKYRVVIFANTFLLTQEQKRFIRSNVARDGRTVVWIYAPGYTDGTTLHNAQDVSNVVGFKLKDLVLPAAPVIAIKGAKNFLDGLSLQFGEQGPVKGPVHPLFAIADKGVTALGTYLGTNDVAFGVKILKDSTRIFCGLPFYNPKLMRAIFQKSGVHIYSPDGDVLLVDNNYLAIHTLTGGNRALWLHNGRRVTVRLRPDSTDIFDARNGRPLLQ